MLNIWSKLMVMFTRLLVSKVTAKVAPEFQPVVDATLDEVQNELFSPSFPNGVKGELSKAQDPKPLGGTDEKPAQDTREPSG